MRRREREWGERAGGRGRDLPPFFPFGWEAGGGGNGVDRERREGVVVG